MVINALTVDVEEYYDTIEIREAAASRGGVSALPSRVEENTDRVLQALGATGVKGTFFVVGRVAERLPAMVRRIAREGHEIGCHSHVHELVSGQTPEAFREDTRRARSAIEDAGGAPVLGYRAPTFSIGPGQRWAYEILAEEGFRYSSSVYPIRHDRYGQPHAPRVPTVVAGAGSGALWEVPIGTFRLAGVNLPIGGGGYFRLLPYAVVRAGLRSVNEREGQAVVFYFHPWELDPDQPRLPMSWHHRFRHYVNLSRVEGKLRRLVRDFRFGPVSALVDSLEPARR